MTNHSLRQGARIGAKIQKTLHGLLVTGAILGAVVIVGSVIFTGATLIRWFDTHTISFRSPVLVKFQSPVVVTENEKEASRTAQLIKPSTPELEPNLPIVEKDLVLSKPHGELLWKIFQRESGRGTNDACRQRGIGFNGLGLGESDEYIKQHGPNCFASQEALWARAEKLIIDLGVDQVKDRAICRWKWGSNFNQPTCLYAQEVNGINF